jgi:hypothetical protein
MDKHSLIRTVYLYTFALLGLVLMTIGGVRFIDMGLKAFVFKQAEQEQRLYNKMPSIAPIGVERLEKIANDDLAAAPLTQSEKTQIQQWLNDYKNWQTQSEKIDPVTAQRHRNASTNLALIIVGLPLYLYHWGVIRKESKRA